MGDIKKEGISRKFHWIKVNGKRIRIGKTRDELVVIYDDEAGPLRYDPLEGISAIKFNSKNRALVYDLILKDAEICCKDLESPSDKLEFLRRSISILQDTGRKFVEKPDLFQDLVFLYWRVFFCDSSEEKSKEINPDIAIDVCQKYLAQLETDAHQEWFDRQEEEPCEENGNAVIRKAEMHKKTVNREKEMRKLVDKMYKLRQKVEKSNDGDAKKSLDQCLGRAKRWLLSRYNLSDARRIEYDFWPVGADEKRKCSVWKGIKWLASNWLPELGALILIVFLLLFVLHPTWFIEEKACFHDGFKLLFLFIYLIFSVPLLTLGCKALLSSQREIDFQVHLPRLAASIVVGYLVLFNDQAWGRIFSQNTALTLCNLNQNLGAAVCNPNLDLGLIFGIIFIPLTAVFIYILIEMNNVSGIRYPLLKKAALLWLRGFSYAVAIGVLISDLLGASIVKRVADKSPACLEGLFGDIYPEVIFLLAPLALFIGVFIQLLWEDKSLTERI